jgi:hypothetical protein
MMLSIIVQLLEQVLTEELMKEAADEILDFIEDYIARTDNKIDDVIVGTAIKAIRAAFDIPDGDD